MDGKTISRNFSYRGELKGDQPARYELILSAAKGLALTIQGACPDSREKSLALTKLDESVMWANAAISRDEG